MTPRTSSPDCGRSTIASTTCRSRSARHRLRRLEGPTDVGGGLALAKGNRYRITFEDRVIVSDGATVWSWSKSNAQVIVDRFRDDPNSLTPERLLIRIPAEYTPIPLGKEKLGKEETTVLKMTPAEGDRSVRWFKLWVDEDRLTILKLQLSDIAENDITYELSDILMNKGLPDSTFRLTPPPGAEILDLR